MRPLSVRVSLPSAGTGGLDANREIALRHELELDPAGVVERIEHVRIRLARERADDLAHASGLEQRGQTNVAVARIVVDDGQLARAARDQRIDQFGGHAGSAETADHHGRAIEHIGDGGLRQCDCLVDH